MHRRLKSFERRLAALAAIVHRRAAEAAREHALHKARNAVAALIRRELERAGIDPAQAPALRRCEALQPPPPPRPPLYRAAPGSAFFERLHTLAERLRGAPPDLASASPAMLLAYYGFGDGAREAPN